MLLWTWVCRYLPETLLSNLRDTQVWDFVIGSSALRSLHTVFHAGALAHIPANSAQVFRFLRILTRTDFPFSTVATVLG